MYVRRELAASAGERSMGMPRASRTSAEPQLEVTARLPCLATLAPAAGGAPGGGGGGWVGLDVAGFGGEKLLHEGGGVLDWQSFAVFQDAAELVLDRHVLLSVTKWRRNLRAKRGVLSA